MIYIQVFSITQSLFLATLNGEKGGSERQDKSERMWKCKSTVATFETTVVLLEFYYSNITVLTTMMVTMWPILWRHKCMLKYLNNLNWTKLCIGLILVPKGWMQINTQTFQLLKEAKKRAPCGKQWREIWNVTVRHCKRDIQKQCSFPFSFNNLLKLKMQML